MKRIERLFLGVLFVASVMSGQLQPGGLALSTAFGEDSNVGGAYALSENKRVNFGVGFHSASPDSGASRTAFAVQTGMWFYRPAVENVSTFYGGSVEFRSSTGARRVGDLGLSANVGVEYSLSRRFAVGTYMGLTFRFGDTSADGNKGYSVGTARMGVFLTWWFA